MSNELNRETALASLYESGDTSLRRGDPQSAELVEVPFVELMNLRGDPDVPSFTGAIRATSGVDLPGTPNTISEGDRYRAFWLAPDEWLLQAVIPHPDPLAIRLEQKLGSIHHSVNDQSSGYSVMQLRGRDARFILNKGCPLDLHPTVFRFGQCAQSHYFKAGVLLYPRDEQGGCWEIIVRRSFADYVARMLLDAMGD